MENLELLLEDFGEVSREAFRAKEKFELNEELRKEVLRKDLKVKLNSKEILEDEFAKKKAFIDLKYAVPSYSHLRFYDGDNLVWWDGSNYHTIDMKTIGVPQDYLSIRDNYEELKKFLEKTLDIGKLFYNVSRDCETIDVAEYPAWLYLNSSRQLFKRNFERAILEILSKEFEREIIPLDIDAELKLERPKLDVDDNFIFSPLESLDSALSRFHWYDDEEDKSFRECFIYEMRKTERPVTREEYIDHFAGRIEDKIKNFETVKLAEIYRFVHYAETSPEFKDALKIWQMKNFAKSKAHAKYAGQFNRLYELLKLINLIDNRSQNFTDIFHLLNAKVNVNLFSDIPTFMNGLLIGENIFEKMKSVLTTVKPNDK